ncbi:hypothetical protein NS44R_15100 [Mammaliicoccus sciuri]|nr:hypothetical protein NS44R_15100 [Mammaliicoccus sciuri]
MSEHREPAIAPWQSASQRRDVGQTLQQRVGDRQAFGDIAMHRDRVAAMAEKIESHGDVAVARKRFGKRLH